MTGWAAFRLALGTLTVVPAGAVGPIDTRTAGRAMLMAPVAVLPVAALATVVAGGGWLAGLPGLVTGLLVVAAVALGTRAMHLDGLADTVDGLGASWGPAGEGELVNTRALQVMRRGDVGPMGVVALVVVLGLQAAAVGGLVHSGRCAVLVGVCVVVSRGALAQVCARGVPAARPDGLGAAVAGSVPRVAVLLSWLLLAALLTVVTAWSRGSWRLGTLAAVWMVLAVAALTRHCVRRFGGVTGDVMGAAVEVALTVLLVCVAVS